MPPTDGLCSDITWLRSPDGVRIAVHDLGGDGSVVLLSHATGFCAHVWDPVAAALAGSHHCLALDYRGYGDSDGVDPLHLRWSDFAIDALTAATHAAATCGDRIVAVGHSMGGAALVSAALRRPDLFRALFLYEPIIFPPPPTPTSGEPPRHGGNILADGARKRRRTFPSLAAALDNFAAKPPMAGFHPDAREGYVRQGFASHPDGSVEMKCTPEFEARTYETSAVDPEWSELARLAVPCWVLSGAGEAMTPAAIAPVVAEQIPDATFVRWDELGHFGPLDHPEFFAGFVARAIAGL